MTRVDNITPEEQFALLLDGELPLEDVGDEIRSLYALTEAIDEHVTAPRAEFAFRAQLREELVTAASGASVSVWERARDAVWMRTARLRNSLRTAVASGVAASMIGGAGVAVAAQQALPGELLYPVKELTESIRMGLAGDLASTGRLHLRFAQERLEEIDEGANTLEAGLLIEALADMDAESIDGAENLLGWATRTGDETVLDELAQFTAQQRDDLQRVIAQLPTAVVPFAEDSLEVLRRIDLELAGEPQPCDCPQPQPVGDAPTVSAPGEPAGTVPRPCECVTATDQVPAPGTPGSITADDGESSTDGSSEQEPSDEADEPAGETDEPVDLVPELPGPLDGAGDTIDDTINELIDELDPVTDPIDDTVDDLTGTVDDATGTVDDTTGTVDDTTGTLDDTTGTLDDTITDTTAPLDDAADTVTDTVG